MTDHLIIPIIFQRMLDDSVTGLEDVANGLVSLVHEVAHLEQGRANRTIHRYTQENKYL